MRGGITVTKPDDNGVILTYDGSSTYSINWTKTGKITKVDLHYSNNSGSIWKEIESNVNVAPGNYTWTIPDDINYNLTIRVRDHNNTAVNDTSINNSCIRGSILVSMPDD